MGRKKDKLVYGWGINDVNYNVISSGIVDGKQKIKWVCPYYDDWRKMIERCFCTKYQERQPTYKGCTISEEWKHLSNFIKWVDSQPNKDWQNCVLDKDFLNVGNKHYSSLTCVYITNNLNLFINSNNKKRGEYMIGVCYAPSTSKQNPYKVQCRNPFTKVTDYIGYYPTELEAHKAWQAKKHEYACKLADLQEDERVAKALRERYAPDKDWTNK